ncbi:MAG: GAF domain-containing protein [Kofleriaceae bacterium]
MAEPADPNGKAPPIEVLAFTELVGRSPRGVVAAKETLAVSLLQITSAIAEAVSADAVYASIVDHLAAVLSASSCGLWLRDGERLQLVRHIGYSAHTEAAVREIALDREPSLPILDAVRHAQPIHIPSQRALFDAYPASRSAATQGRGYRVTCVPLVIDETALGALGLTFEEEREPTSSEQSLLLLVARYATHALERLRILEAERRSRERADAVARRMTILSHASRAFGEAHIDHEQRLQNIVREVGTLMDAASTIGLVESDGRLHHIATYHPDAAAHELTRDLAGRFPQGLHEGLSGEVVRTGASSLLTDLDPRTVAERAPPAYREFFAQFPIYAAMIAPLRVHGRSIGVITAVRVQPGQTFDRDDLELLESLADRAASAIENSRLTRDANEARHRAEQLYMFANAAVDADALDAVFDAALAAIIDALRAQRASILLFDDDDVMRFKAWRGLSDRYRSAVEGHSPWSRDEKSPSPVLVADCLHDPAWAPYAEVFRSEGIAALSFIPLVSRGKLLGKFMVYYDEPHVFDASDVEISRAIANLLASMITRFRAVAELERTIRDNELFAGVLAHDLRNPLSAILTAAQLALMHNEGGGERASKPLSRIVSSAERMSNMITQLLDFTRARVGGGIEIRRCTTSLLDLSNQVVAELELAHPDRELEVRAFGDHHGNWDPDRLLQVVSNLVGNACQHGRPSCKIEITIDGRGPDLVILSVQNQGTITPPLLPRIFEPFRGQERRHGSPRGLGLGLYIVREIARSHHGSVDVRSTEREGTTFSVRLPRN